MLRKKINIITACMLASMITFSFGLVKPAYAKDSEDSAELENQQKVLSKSRVSVHDPSIVRDNDTYYVFGSHIEAAKSKDLQNWTKFSNSYTTPDNVIFGDLSKNLAGSFAWAGENDSDCKGGFSVWAPSVIYNDKYVNKDGSIGAYMMYYCTSSTYKRSCIGFAVSKNIEGPYTYGNTIIYSGFTKGDSHDDKSTINTNYENTNLKTLIDNGSISGINNKWFSSNGGYNTSYAPNAIDPQLFTDAEGKMWMCYGSWSGGIYLLEIDPSSGNPIYPTDSNENYDGVNITDRYFGTKIAGGFTKSGEGPEIVYDKDTGYYYLYMSYAGLAANGGYNIRMFRSKSVKGPYLDAEGNNAALPSNVDNSYCGIKLIGNYKFFCNKVGYKAAGHNSSFIDSDGNMYLVYHTRFNGGTEEHQVRVHQMFINEDGWPVVAPYENSGDKISETGYPKEEIVGNYQFINHGKDSSSKMIDTLNVKLNDDFTVSGDVTGTWSMKDGSYYMNLVTSDNVVYKGVFFKMQDESNTDNKVMTFTALGDNNECIWGSKLDLDDKSCTKYASTSLESVVPSKTREDLDLPSTGAYDTKIKWSSSNNDAIDGNGKVSRGKEDENVTLTATITKGNESFVKTFNVTVEGKLEELTAEPILKYECTTSDSVKISSTGSRDEDAKLVGDAQIEEDETRGNVLSIKNSDKAVKGNFLSLPSDTFDNITGDGYTVSMWVNVNKDDPNYFEHSALFEANNGGTYPMTRISANLFGRINANNAYSDATEVSKGLKSNVWQYVTYTVNKDGIVVYLDGNEVAREDKDISLCFENNFLSKMKNVTVGSGCIWNDRDVSDAKFDNIAVFDKALTSKEVEALYNEEVENKNNDDNKDDDNKKEKVSLETKVETSWDNNVKEMVKITNSTKETISNWSLNCEFDGKINELWSAEIESQDGSKYVIKNPGWKKDIKPGETIEIGFIASYSSEEIPEIKNYEVKSN